MDFMAGKFTTGGKVSPLPVWQQLEPVLKSEGVELHSIKLYENSKDICGVFRVTLTVIIKMAYKKKPSSMKIKLLQSSSKITEKLLNY